MDYKINGTKIEQAKEKEKKKRIHMHFFFFIIEKHNTHTQLKLIHYILRHMFTLIMSMINSDHLQAGQIQRKLQSKQFILIKNEKNNHELWNHDISLICQINTEGALNKQTML